MPRTRAVRPNNPPSERGELENVLTITEVAEGWNKHYKTVQLAIDTNRLTARKTGNTWLISRSSVLRVWGVDEETKHERNMAQGE